MGCKGKKKGGGRRIIALFCLLACFAACGAWQQSLPPAPQTVGQSVVAANAAIEGLARETTVLVQGGAISSSDGAQVLAVLGAASILVDQMRTDLVDPNGTVDTGVVLAQVEALIASARDLLVRAERR